MNRKKVEIPFQELVNDSRSISQFRLQEDLVKMKECLPTSSHRILTSATLNVNKELILLRKKRTRKQSSEISVQHNFLNISKLGLRKVLQQQKVKSITRNFINKMKRNITESKPVEYHPYVYNYGEGFFNRDGFQIPNWFDLTFAFLSIIQIFMLFFVYTLALVFQQFVDSQFISTLQTFSMCFYTIQIIINFVSVKRIEGRKIVALKEIFVHYVKRKFFIDLLCLVILIVDVNIKFFMTSYFRLCVILKIRECLWKMEKIQNVFINNFYKQQYWSLAKVFFVNFGFAHVLAVLLLAMANLSQMNWIKRLDAQYAPWYELYSWAYYWGTTIMLTVGFGDLSASNYKQAICLTIIQTFSCILLAYNINCVGNLITNIRTQDQEKTKNFRIMRKLAESNQIKHELEWKVCNFIDESDKMKKQFGFDDQKQFISNLPPQLKAEFLKYSNIKIFESINFFKSFTEKTLLNLAEKIEMKIAHPEQVIFRSEEIPQLLILKEGKIGYCTRLVGSDFSGTVIDKLKIGSKEKPKLVYLGFLAENERNVKFKIKSLHYSMIYFIGVEEAKQVMKNVSADFQKYCQIKDKSKHILDEFEIIPCEYCPTKHTKMSCPRLHYIPLYQIVIYKYLENVKILRNSRIHFNRTKLNSSKPFKLRSYFQKLSETVYKNKQSGKVRREATKKDDEIKTNNKLQIESSWYIQRIASMLTGQKQQLDGAFEWDIHCDNAHNFKFYFQDCNSSQLMNRVLKNKKNISNSICFPELTRVIGSANFLL